MDQTIEDNEISKEESKMQSNEYESPVMEIVYFETEDVIRTSGNDGIDTGEGGLGGLVG